MVVGGTGKLRRLSSKNSMVLVEMRRVWTGSGFQKPLMLSVVNHGSEALSELWRAAAWLWVSAGSWT